ncbi:MAG: nucleotidyl transferase AbiEii/AbiGii toxin family protein [bacterium]
METQRDFEELLGSFNAHSVEYVIVGGYALAFHGAPRFTGDLDLFVRPGPDNAARILAALADFGFASLGLTSTDFERPDRVVQLGVPPVRVDLITSIAGVTWGEAAAGRVEGDYGGVRVPFLGRAQFVANKRAAGRRRDLADLEALGES